MMNFLFSDQKNELLFRKRGITFPQIIEAIAENGIVLDLQHPNKLLYPEQHMLVVELNGYAYCVPYVIDGDTLFLKTIYPSRKYLCFIKGKNDEQT